MQRRTSPSGSQDGHRPEEPALPPSDVPSGRSAMVPPSGWGVRVPESHIGPILREARERHGFTREAFARSLRISVKTLRALEEGEYAALPADVYVRGFVRQCAEALGLDPVPLLRSLALERARVPVRPTVFPWTLRTRHSTVWESVTPRTLALAGGTAVLCAILLYVLFHVRTFVRAPRLDVVSPTGNAEVQTTTLTVRGRTDPTAELSINGERTPVREDGSFEETLGVSTGVNTLRIVAKSIRGRESTVVREILVRSTGTGTSAGQPTSPTTLHTATVSPTVGPFTVTVRAERATVWVSLGADGTTSFSGLLASGAERSVTGERITVSSGKAAHTLVRIGDAAPRALGTAPGPLRGVLFTRDPKTGTIGTHGLAEVPRD